MPSHEETHHSPYSSTQLFAMVADVAKYPEFLPWCRAARILNKRSENSFEAELVISFKGLTQSYVSVVTLYPAPPGEPSAIEVEESSGPFEHLVNNWRFTPARDGGTDVHLFIDFKFRSRMLEMLIGGIFTEASHKMITAFGKRADVLYGKK